MIRSVRRSVRILVFVFISIPVTLFVRFLFFLHITSQPEALMYCLILLLPAAPLYCIVYYCRKHPCAVFFTVGSTYEPCFPLCKKRIIPSAGTINCRKREIEHAYYVKTAKTRDSSIDSSIIRRPEAPHPHQGGQIPGAVVVCSLHLYRFISIPIGGQASISIGGDRHPYQLGGHTGSAHPVEVPFIWTYISHTAPG